MHTQTEAMRVKTGARHFLHPRTQARMHTHLGQNAILDDVHAFLSAVKLTSTAHDVHSRTHACAHLYTLGRKSSLDDVCDLLAGRPTLQEIDDSNVIRNRLIPLLHDKRLIRFPPCDSGV